jgi:hypothetical protein
MATVPHFRTNQQRQALRDAWLRAGGYASQTLCTDIARTVSDDGRPAVLLVASDFDPSGEDLARDFAERTGCWEHVQRVALTDEDVRAYGLPEMLGKATDSRAEAFTARHGGLVQVELDALDPGVLLAKYRTAAEAWWDEDAHQAVLDQEAAERERLEELADEIDEP